MKNKILETKFSLLLNYAPTLVQFKKINSTFSGKEIDENW